MSTQTKKYRKFLEACEELDELIVAKESNFIAQIPSDGYDSPERWARIFNHASKNGKGLTLTSIQVQKLFKVVFKH